MSDVVYSVFFSFFLFMLTLSFCMPQILHHHIAAVEKLPLTTSGCPLVIQCKNFRIVHFVVPRERDCHDVYNSLLQLSRTGETSNWKRLCSMYQGNKLVRNCMLYFFVKCTLCKSLFNGLEVSKNFINNEVLIYMQIQKMSGFCSSLILFKSARFLQIQYFKHQHQNCELKCVLF